MPICILSNALTRVTQRQVHQTRCIPYQVVNNMNLLNNAYKYPKTSCTDKALTRIRHAHIKIYYRSYKFTVGNTEKKYKREKLRRYSHNQSTDKPINLSDVLLNLEFDFSNGLLWGMTGGGAARESALSNCTMPVASGSERRCLTVNTMFLGAFRNY